MQHEGRATRRQRSSSPNKDSNHHENWNEYPVDGARHDTRRRTRLVQRDRRRPLFEPCGRRAHQFSQSRRDGDAECRGSGDGTRTHHVVRAHHADAQRSKPCERTRDDRHHFKRPLVSWRWGGSTRGGLPGGGRRVWEAKAFATRRADCDHEARLGRRDRGRGTAPAG